MMRPSTWQDHLVWIGLSFKQSHLFRISLCFSLALPKCLNFTIVTLGCKAVPCLIDHARTIPHIVKHALDIEEKQKEDRNAEDLVNFPWPHAPCENICVCTSDLLSFTTSLAWGYLEGGISYMSVFFFLSVFHTHVDAQHTFYTIKTVWYCLSVLHYNWHLTTTTTTTTTVQSISTLSLTIVSHNQRF